MQLPNQTTTWGRPIESFEDWNARESQRFNFASEMGALQAYLTDQLKVESADMVGLRFNHPILGLVAHLGERDNRARELLYAYMALTVAGDAGPAHALIAGQRLNPHLHDEYVARTCCYGAPSDDWRPWADKLIAAVRTAVESGIQEELYAGYPSVVEGFVFELHADLPYGRPKFVRQIRTQLATLPEFLDVDAQFRAKFGRGVLENKPDVEPEEETRI